jgi:hypothetical protein
MSTKIQFTNNDQYDEFKNDHEFFRMIYETWDGVDVRVEFDDDNRIVEFEGMREHEVSALRLALLSKRYKLSNE